MPASRICCSRLTFTHSGNVPGPPVAAWKRRQYHTPRMLCPVYCFAGGMPKLSMSCSVALAVEGAAARPVSFFLLHNCTDRFVLAVSLGNLSVLLESRTVVTSLKWSTFGFSLFIWVAGTAAFSLWFCRLIMAISAFMFTLTFVCVCVSPKVPLG